MARDTRKTLKREKNEKRKVREKFNNVRRIIKLLTFYGKRHILVKNIIWENVVYLITFLVKLCLML